MHCYYFPAGPASYSIDVPLETLFTYSHVFVHCCSSKECGYWTASLTLISMYCFCLKKGIDETMKNQSFLRWMRRVTFFAAMLAILVTAFAFQTGSASAHGTAWVRVVHAAPEAGDVDVYVDQQKLLNSFSFASVTGYVSLGEGKHRVEVTPAGAGLDKAVIDKTVWVKAGRYYTLAALGTKDSGFSLRAFADNNSVPDDKASVRVYHLSPDAGPVDVAVGGTTVIKDKDLKYPHASGYLKVAPGDYTFKVTVVNAGASVDLSAKLNADTVYSVFALGLLNGSPEFRFIVCSFPPISTIPKIFPFHPQTSFPEELGSLSTHYK